MKKKTKIVISEQDAKLRDIMHRCLDKLGDVVDVEHYNKDTNADFLFQGNPQEITDVGSSITVLNSGDRMDPADHVLLVEDDSDATVVVKDTPKKDKHLQFA